MPQSPKSLRFIQTFDTLSGSDSYPEKRYDIFSFNQNVKILGIAVFTQKFVLVHEGEFSLGVKISNLRTGVFSGGQIDFREISEAGIRKVWGDQALSAEEGSFIKVELEFKEQYGCCAKNSLISFVRNVEDSRALVSDSQNDPRVVFTRKCPRFVCGIYFSKNTT